MESKLSQGSRALRILAGLFFVASPLLMMLILSLMSGENMLLSKPYLNDEISYWRLLWSLDNCGLSFGSTEHLVGYVAPIGPLGSHGLSPLVAWGWYVLLFPMTDSAIVLAGLMLLCLSMALLWLIARPSPRQLLLMGAFTLAFGPMVRYINLSMLEMPCYAGCIVYAALLWRYEKEICGHLPRRKATLALLLLCGLYCSLLRMSNVVLFFPAILIFCHNKIGWKLICCLGLYALGVVAFNWVFSLFVAPYPDVLYGLMQSETLEQLLSGLCSNITGNIRRFLDPWSDNSLPQALARYCYLACLLLLAVMCLVKKEQGRLRLTWRWPYFGMLGAVGGCLALVIGIYFVFDWRDYRTLAPMSYFAVLWLLLRWGEEGRGFKASLAALMVFAALMAPEAYSHVAQDPRFYPDESTGLDYSELFTQEPCTLGLYGTDYPLALAKDVPPQVGICEGLYGEDSHGFGMDYILCRPGDPAPSTDYYSYLAPMEGYGELYIRDLK